jgi:hypothetical protein
MSHRNVCVTFFYESAGLNSIWAMKFNDIIRDAVLTLSMTTVVHIFKVTVSYRLRERFNSSSMVSALAAPSAVQVVGLSTR